MLTDEQLVELKRELRKDIEAEVQAAQRLNRGPGIRLPTLDVAFV